MMTLLDDDMRTQPKHGPLTDLAGRGSKVVGAPISRA